MREYLNVYVLGRVSLWIANHLPEQVTMFAWLRFDEFLHGPIQPEQPMKVARLQLVPPSTRNTR